MPILSLFFEWLMLILYQKSIFFIRCCIKKGKYRHTLDPIYKKLKFHEPQFGFLASCINEHFVFPWNVPALHQMSVFKIATPRVIILVFCHNCLVGYKKRCTFRYNSHRNRARGSQELFHWTCQVWFGHPSNRTCNIDLFPLTERSKRVCFLSPTPSFTQCLLQSRLSPAWLFLVDCWIYEITDVPPWLSLASRINVVPLYDAFLICCDLQPQVAHTSWLSHLWLSASHGQTGIDRTGSTPVVLSANGPKHWHLFLCLQGLKKKKSGQNWKLTFSLSILKMLL